MISILALLLLPTSFADVFQDHTVSVETQTCKKLDFDSYGRAQSSKSNLIQSNPDLTHANFGGKYLLLKNELMLETLWLIADCSTGKFFRENLSGDATFKPNSDVLILKNKDGSELHQWTGKEWTKIGDTRVAPQDVVLNPTPTPANQANDSKIVTVQETLKSYQKIFADHPAELKSISCKKIDFDSHPQAQTAKGNILDLNKDVTHPNFGGQYLLLKNRLLFDTRWFVVDCASGKFFRESLTGDFSFQANSTMVIINRSGKAPSLKAWTDEQWQELPDPILAEKDTATNTISGSSAKTLFRLIPNPRHDTTLRFEKLKCGDTCSVEVAKSQTQINLPENEMLQLKEVLHKWGFNSQIRSGTCSTERSQMICKIETTTKDN